MKAKIHNPFICLSFLLIFLSSSQVLFAASNRPPQPQLNTVIHNAINYLISQQKKDGSIHSGRYPTAMTALTIMAMLAVGHLPDEPTPYGKAITRALQFVLRDDRTDNFGYYGGVDGSRMYGHAIVTLMLAEIAGMIHDPAIEYQVHQKLDKAVKLILWAQKRKNKKQRQHFGGWRYLPTSSDSDLSVTIWQLMALRAAKNAGLPLPRQAITDALAYVRLTYYSPRNNDGSPTKLNSACSYQPGKKPSYASASAGLLALQLCGLFDAPEVQGTARWLNALKLQYNHSYFFYGTYYYSQAMYQMGGSYATQAWQNITAILFPRQRKDGSWLAAGGQERQVGAVYATAMAVLALSVKYHYLPIYQR
ncbi:MAG: hypothetical protein D6820_17090 [Lentisphaerae bacterium]|nr:MAG: hypothetical protein D6820_17090 [Lentisphaerota bacterium]